MANETGQKVERRAVWVMDRLHQMAKEIAARDQISIPEAIERDLDAPLTRRYRRMFPESELGEPVG